MHHVRARQEHGRSFFQLQRCDFFIPLTETHASTIAKMNISSLPQTAKGSCQKPSTDRPAPAGEHLIHAHILAHTQLTTNEPVCLNIPPQLVLRVQHMIHSCVLRECAVRSHGPAPQDMLGIISSMDQPLEFVQTCAKQSKYFCSETAAKSLHEREHSLLLHQRNPPPFPPPDKEGPLLSPEAPISSMARQSAGSRRVTAPLSVADILPSNTAPPHALAGPK